MTPCVFVPQLQLTQRIPVPQEPVSIIVPIVYDMATGLTQQADIPRQHSSSGAAALMVSNILKRFNELHPARQGESLPMNTESFTVITFCVLTSDLNLYSSQASVQYLLLFTSSWPTSLCLLALVSEEINCPRTGTQLTADASIADVNCKLRITTVEPKNIQHVSSLFNHWTSEWMCRRQSERVKCAGADPDVYSCL